MTFSFRGLAGGAVWAVAMLVASCAGSRPVVGGGGDVAVVPALEPLGPTMVADPGEVPAEAFEPELLPEALVGRLALHEYTVTDHRQDAVPTREVSVAAVLENLQPDAVLVLELAARFEEPDGTAVFQTTWSRASIPPHRRHHYAANSVHPRAGTGRLLIRLVEAP